MGLDVYLYRYNGDRGAIKAEEDAYEAAESKVYEDLPGDTEEIRARRKKVIAKLRVEHGYVGDGSKTYEIFRHSKVTCIEQDSKVQPDHLMKVGYFRSSYNAGGINSVARQNKLPDLNEVMGNTKDKYEFVPDWKASRDRAQKAADAFRELQASGKALRCTFEGAVRQDAMAKSQEDALRIAAENLFMEGDRPFGGGGYSNASGAFWPKGLEVVAILPGVQECIIGKVTGRGGQTPGAYIVTKEDLEWYAKAYDIVVETCDYVLGQPDPSQYLLHWSG